MRSCRGGNNVKGKYGSESTGVWIVSRVEMAPIFEWLAWWSGDEAESSLRGHWLRNSLCVSIFTFILHKVLFIMDDMLSSWWFTMKYSFLWKLKLDFMQIQIVHSFPHCSRLCISFIPSFTYFHHSLFIFILFHYISLLFHCWYTSIICLYIPLISPFGS